MVEKKSMGGEMSFWCLVRPRRSFIVVYVHTSYGIERKEMDIFG
jgi:hypothetical protein